MLPAQLGHILGFPKLRQFFWGLLWEAELKLATILIKGDSTMRKISLRTSILVFAGSLALASGIIYCTWLAPDPGVQARGVARPRVTNALHGKLNSSAPSVVAVPTTAGTGVVTVTSDGTSCVAITPAKGGGPDDWEVVEGGKYTMMISGVTECSGDTITVFVQGSSTGNFCFNANKVSAGTYSGGFTMPNPACNT